MAAVTLTVDVTAAAGGSYINPLPAGSLVTGNGSNASPAAATLSVVQSIPGTVVPPLVGKAFSPATIIAGGASTLVITLSNPNATVATLTAPLVDTLPSGMVIAATPNVGTTCGGVGPAGGRRGGVDGDAACGTHHRGQRQLYADRACLCSTRRFVQQHAPRRRLGDRPGQQRRAGRRHPDRRSALSPPAAGIPTLSEWAMIMLAALWPCSRGADSSARDDVVSQRVSERVANERRVSASRHSGGYANPG